MLNQEQLAADQLVQDKKKAELEAELAKTYAHITQLLKDKAKYEPTEDDGSHDGGLEG